ncbi:MAG: TonB-dependent receptor, partial [Vicinamibacterales bacterium]
HQLKIGGQFERGEHAARGLIPTGVRYVEANGLASEAISSPPSNVGGVSVTAAAFASDAITIGNRLTLNAGIRFDHSRAFHQGLPALDAQGSVTDQIVDGGETLYTWNLFSPRLGVTAKLSADGRTILRASYGRFTQGVLTGELEPFHPGSTATTTRVFNPSTGDYSGMVRVVDPKINLQLDREMRAPRTDEFSIGLDREVGRRLAVAMAYVRKNGANFIGWTDVGGQYREETRTLSDNRVVPAFTLTNLPSARRFRLTNPDGYSLTYDGLVMVAEKRRSHGWQAFGSYTFSKAFGLQPSSGATAAGAQASTVSPPQPIVFGRDPNDLTNARGRLPNDRPHMMRVMGSVDVPRTGFVIAANLQHFSGKPWAETAIIPTQQGDLRILLEPRGSRRLSSQSLLDVRLSRTVSFGGRARIELLLDVLNVLNDRAEEGLASDNVFSPNFQKPTLFMDPRRVMLGARLNLGR